MVFTTQIMERLHGISISPCMGCIEGGIFAHLLRIDASTSWVACAIPKIILLSIIGISSIPNYRSIGAGKGHRAQRNHC